MTGFESFFFGTGPVEWVQHAIGLGYPAPFRVVSLLGDTYGVVLAVGVAFWLFGRRALYATAGVAAGAGIVKALLNLVFSVPRPQGPEIVVYEHVTAASFPSGHLLQAVAMWGLLWALGYVRAWVPALVVVLVAIGRLYLGTHYVGDLIGGLAFGAALVWTYHAVWPSLYGWLSGRSQTFYDAAAALTVAGGGVALVLLGGDPRRYEIVGIAVGAALALRLEARLVHYEPGPRSWRGALARVLVGSVGIAVFAVWDRAFHEPALYLGAAFGALSALWAVLLAPALVQGWHGRRATGAAPEAPATEDPRGGWPRASN